MVKSLKNPNSRMKTLIEDNREYTTEIEKANLLAKNFEKVFYMNDSNTIEQQEIIQEVENFSYNNDRNT